MALAVDTSTLTGTGMVDPDDELELFIDVPATADRLLLVFVFYKILIGSPNGFTAFVLFDSGFLPLTKCGNTSTMIVDDKRLCAEIWYLNGPASGLDKELLVLWDAAYPPLQSNASAVVVTGAEQTSSVIRLVGQAATYDTTPTIDMPSAASELIFDCVAANEAPGMTVGAGQTQMINEGNAGVLGGGTSFQTGDATGRMSWTLGASKPWASFAIVVIPTGILTTKAATETCKLGESETSAVVKTTAVSPSYFQSMIGLDFVDILVNTLKIERQQGQPSTCEITIVNPDHAPEIGKFLSVFWISPSGAAFQIFVGNVDRIVRKTNNTGTFVTYDISAVDQVFVMTRRLVASENWSITSETFQNVVSNILGTWLAGDGDSGWIVGTMDNASVEIPYVSAKLGTNVLELLHDVAASVGCTFYVSPTAKAISFVSTSAPSAPFSLDENIIEEASVSVERNEYRNVQYVLAKGTPASASTTDEAKALKIAFNNEQITAVKVNEGGSGRFENVEEVTHPVSNDQATIELFAQSVARVLIRIGSTYRRKLSCRFRSAVGTTFTAGMVVTTAVPRLGIPSSTWIVQSVSIEDEDGRYMICHLELTESNNIRRYLDAWLRIVQKGKTAITAPDLIVNNIQLFTASGTFVVPGGVTQLLVTIYGAGGGGGGAIDKRGDNTVPKPTGYNTDGGFGGNGGKAVSLLSVTPAESLTVTVGAGGAAGTRGSVDFHPGNFTDNYVAPSGGSAGGTSTVKRSSTVLIQATGGGGGQPGVFTPVGPPPATFYPGADGTAGGGGPADGATTGGGRLGGRKGYWATFGLVPLPGESAVITIEWFA